MARSIKIDFFRVEIEREDLNLENLFQQILQLPDDESRTAEIRNFPIRLQQANYSADFWAGEMIRIRMEEIPTKASLDGETELINLDDDEGIGENTAFLYHVPSRVLLLQRNRFGVSASSFSQYYREITNIGCPIELKPILAEGDALRRIQQMGVIRKFEVRAAGLDRMDTLQPGNTAVEEILELRDEFQAPNINLTLSVGNRRDVFLSPQRVINAARTFLNISNNSEGQVNTIKISGADSEEDDTKLINLLEFCVREEVDIRQSALRTTPYNELARALTIAWDRRIEELRRMYSFGNS